MKFLSLISLIFMAFAPLLHADNSSKVKITTAKLLIENPEYYVVPSKVQVVKVNETYNRFENSFERKKDLPRDVTFTVEVYRSDLGCDDFKKIREYIIPNACTDTCNKYSAYLPSSLTPGKCLVKGYFRNCDANYFKFYDLLSDEELKNAKFIMTRSYLACDKILHQLKYEFVSNLH